jgi:hypothetical protein
VLACAGLLGTLLESLHGKAPPNSKKQTLVFRQTGLCVHSLAAIFSPVCFTTIQQDISKKCLALMGKKQFFVGLPWLPSVKLAWQDLRGQIVAMANREWPRGSERFGWTLRWEKWVANQQRCGV